MSNYLSKKEQSYYSKHFSRSISPKATKGERVYSNAWVSGFHSIWDNDGVYSISNFKSSFEITAFNRGCKFAKKVLKR